ncbi:MFS transporter [Rhodococcus opacus]|uniref:MFS transporter n=1 Tax=Rhodococcus sp. LB1 TaxID=1807499 RepID=UPI00077AE653|nr:MFS transporter [Rhodococcus sp. LB1]KXX55396.1 transporter [Rhodococcus sp. LB1]WKN60764.1 MFS transporter [Rhodococcus opacus]
MEPPIADTRRTESTSSRTSPRRAALAAFLGTVIEFYDLVIYGTAAALVFGEVFFRDVSPQVALIMSFATFATGYLVRPVGGLLFGYIGDRFGRRSALMITIAMMGAATVLIGVLPTYATVGALAPIMLLILRLIQGLAIGGEQGGAVLIAVEHAPPNKRGFYGSFSTAGAQGGTVVATAVFALVTLMPEDALMTWGWRVPFLLSAAIVIVGLIVRNGLEETPDFKQVAGNAKNHNPVRQALVQHPRTILGITLVMGGVFACWYILTVYSLSYAVKSVGIDRTTMLWLITAATLLVVIMNPVWGALSDRIGRTKLVAGGLVIEGVLLVVYFGTLTTGNLALIFVAMLATTGCGHAMINGVFPAFVTESLPAEVRYTAGSFGIQLAGVLGGFAPLVAVTLEGSSWGVWSIPIICLVICVVGAISAYTLVSRSQPAITMPEVEPAPAPTV